MPIGINDATRRKTAGLTPAWGDETQQADRPVPASLTAIPAHRRKPAAPDEASLISRRRREASTHSKSQQGRYNSLLTTAEERQLALEQLAKVLAEGRSNVALKAATDRAASQELAAARAAAESELTVEPAVALVLKQKELEASLARTTRALDAASEYSTTLEHMDKRQQYEHALIRAELEDFQAEAREADRELGQLRAAEGEARKDKASALQALVASKKAYKSNQMLYAAALRKQRIDTQGEDGAKGGAKGKGGKGGGKGKGGGALRELGGGGGAAADGARPSLAGGGDDGEAGEEERLKRMLIATRMSSLVLMQERDSHVEQVSRYEAAFLKMARLAGSADPDAIIAKFARRNDVRARLLDERQGMRQRLTKLEAELRNQTAKMGELQYSMVHPAEADGALRQVEPKLTAALGRLEQLEQGTARLSRLQLSVFTGTAHLQHLLSAAATCTANITTNTTITTTTTPNNHHPTHR